MIAQVLYEILGLCVAVLINSPLLRLLCVYVLWEEPTLTDTLGNCLLDCCYATSNSDKIISKWSF